MSSGLAQHAHVAQQRHGLRIGILTASQRAAAGIYEDVSGQAIRQRAEQAGWRVVEALVLPDDRAAIAAAIIRLVDELDVDLVLTTGGTGLSPTDVTPQATLDVIEYQVPGLAEAMRLEGYRQTPFALLSRAVAGVRRRSLIINLPGSPRGVNESLDVIMPVLPHAVSLLRS